MTMMVETRLNEGIKILQCCVAMMLMLAGGELAPHAYAEAPAFEQAFVRANDTYKNADYKRAAQMYEQLASTGAEAVEVYFNLGNCYYKLGNIAAAILNYERAQRLAPLDDDVEFNLSLAQSRIADRIDPAPQFFVIKWWHTFVGLATAGSWSIAGTVFVWCAVLCAAVFFIALLPGLRKTMFVSSIVLFVLTGFMLTFAYQQNKAATGNENAVVFASSVSVKSEPQESSKDLFVLHEGTKVDVLEADGEWRKIHIADGSVGWLRSNTIEII
jgi:tetratricopeptide (TPR) repeat protein